MKNVAVFGAGRIGRIHAANLAALPGVALKFVCDPMGDAAEERVPWTSDGQRHWLRAEVRATDGALQLLSNAVFINWQTKP